jgi:hypothetical protein
VSQISAEAARAHSVRVALASMTMHISEGPLRTARVFEIGRVLAELFFDPWP